MWGWRMITSVIHCWFIVNELGCNKWHVIGNPRNFHGQEVLFFFGQRAKTACDSGGMWFLQFYLIFEIELNIERWQGIIFIMFIQSTISSPVWKRFVQTTNNNCFAVIINSFFNIIYRFDLMPFTGRARSFHMRVNRSSSLRESRPNLNLAFIWNFFHMNMIR